MGAVLREEKRPMGQIIGLAFASAGSLAFQLLAIDLVILTRRNPRPLLWAFWLTALVVSCGFGSIALTVFRAKGTFLGTTSRTVSPAIYLIVGVIAVGVAAVAATSRGRDLIGRELDKRKGAPAAESSDSLADRVRARAEGVKTKAEEALQRGSVWVAIAVGFVMGAPTPFQLAAIGVMVRHGYSLPAQLLLILGFSLVTYVVVEVPIVMYAIWPDATSTRVQSFSAWLGTHKIEAAAVVAAVVGLILIVKGLTAL
jgi:hypothetical protein